MSAMLRNLFLYLFAFCVSISFANVDLFFEKKLGKTCFSFTPMMTKCRDNNGINALVRAHSARIRIVGEPTMDSAPHKFYLNRPFFILDGIYLGTEEKRTLSQFYKETMQFGIPEILKSLGYTPVLVQFSETVHRNLKTNAEIFKDILTFFNSNNEIPFPNKQQDGFVVLGISQGGIIGRYGAYLYDKEKKITDAPIKIFASLDSPHQGAVMPRGLVSTLDFWANEAEIPAAEEFYDLISSPGARELLIYDTKVGNSTYSPKTSSDRFLFGDYRKAADYKGFPVVLISQGQLKGKSPSHNAKFYELNRYASLFGRVLGRAESEMAYSDSESGEYSFNRMYEFNSEAPSKTKKGKTNLDFIQGSTYPFAKTMYESLKEGMLEAMPKNMKKKIKVAGVTMAEVSLDTRWQKDSLYEASSTFIPTTSAMDLKCDGDLSIRKNCAYTQSSSGFPFENPQNYSTAKAVYAVDPSHPRYTESKSGRHIELPVNAKGNVDKKVLAGMQTDVWRVLCEVAKADYDANAKKFRNPHLTGFFSTQTSCMDQSKMPDVIKNGGVLQAKEFVYSRYDFNASATEKNKSVTFNLPAGWQKVAMFDNGGDLPSSSIFEVSVKVENPKSNWMKAELLITTRKDGGSQVQLSEISVVQDGEFHLIRWKLPSKEGALDNFRWFRLILNSNGAKVTLQNPRILKSANDLEEIPQNVSSQAIYPNSNYSILKWSDKVIAKDYSDANGSGILFEVKDLYDGASINLKKSYSMDAYNSLKVEYWPNTCQQTSIFFDAKSSKNITLSNGELQNAFAVKRISLKDLINTDITPKGSLSASRLSLQAMKTNERCVIHAISLEK